MRIAAVLVDVCLDGYAIVNNVFPTGLSVGYGMLGEACPLVQASEVLRVVFFIVWGCWLRWRHC